MPLDDFLSQQWLLVHDARLRLKAYAAASYARRPGLDKYNQQRTRMSNPILLVWFSSRSLCERGRRASDLGRHGANRSVREEVYAQELIDNRYLAEMEKSAFFDQLWAKR
jgi:hypothetical protein